MNSWLILINLTFFCHSSVPIRVLLLGEVVLFGTSDQGLSDALPLKCFFEDRLKNRLEYPPKMILGGGISEDLTFLFPFEGSGGHLCKVDFSFHFGGGGFAVIGDPISLNGKFQVNYISFNRTRYRGISELAGIGAGDFSAFLLEYKIRITRTCIGFH